MEIRVDHEFETKIPPLTEEEFRNLEKSILTDGEIISPIIIWNGIIVDGHNRYHILKKTSGAQVFREGNGFYGPGRSFELDLPESAWQKESYNNAEDVSDRSSV